MAEQTERRLVRPRTIAEHYGINARTIRKWVHDGLIKGYRLGERVMVVDEIEIEQLLRQIEPKR